MQPHPRDLLDAKGPLPSPYDFVDPITWNGGPSRDNDAILKTLGLSPLKKRRKKRKVYHSLTDVEGDPEAVDADKISTNRSKKHVKVSSDPHDEGLLRFERPLLSKKKRKAKKNHDNLTTPTQMKTWTIASPTLQPVISNSLNHYSHEIYL